MLRSNADFDPVESQFRTCKAADGGPMLQVTKPIEVHGEGSADSDSEEEDYDRERQHSVMPHPAGASPFGSKVLKRFPQREMLSQSSSGFCYCPCVFQFVHTVHPGIRVI